MQRGPTVETQYFGQQNHQQLFSLLAQDFQQKQGPLTEKQKIRLGKTLDHYMREVWDTNGPMPIQQLNRETVGATAKDFTGYLRRDVQMPSTAASQSIVSDSRNQPRMEMAMLTQRPTFEQGLLQDTGSRFEQLQQDRIGNDSRSVPPPPDFQISLSAAADEPSALSLYESAKKSREQEAARVSATQQDTSQTDINPLVRFMSPPSIQNDPNTNPTLALPMAPAPRGPLQQDFIIKQDDIISYKETEYNLIIYSADRDWLNNTRETRYTFSVNFDPANNQQGFNYSPSSNKKFKNISRIELVKAIIPTEGLETLVAQGGSGAVTTSKLNALSFPYVIVRIPELDNNNFGTDTYLDNSFGVLQYDANWYTDTVNLTDGYLAMIPKFMKCQKTYLPTPLATLTKLSIEMQRPDGTPLSTIADTLSISKIFIGGTGGNALPTGYTSTLYGTNPGYIFLVTSTHFSQWTFAEGNRIQIRGLDASQLAGGSTQAGIDLVQYLHSNSLPIVGIATSGGNDGANAVGYANIIIIRTSYADPTTGSVAINYFGGGSVAYNTLGVSLKTTTFTSGKLINLTHQTNLVLRIITRELDPTARVRPDNL